MSCLQLLSQTDLNVFLAVALERTCLEPLDRICPGQSLVSCHDSHPQACIRVLWKGTDSESDPQSRYKTAEARV